MDKKLFWTWRITIGIVGIIALFKIMPYFMNMIVLLIELYKITDTSPEFKIILLSISLWVNLQVISIIIKIISKLDKIVFEKSMDND